jgi:ABC-type hemin transport system ATPase subunit
MLLIYKLSFCALVCCILLEMNIALMYCFSLIVMYDSVR